MSLGRIDLSHLSRLFDLIKAIHASAEEPLIWETAVRLLNQLVRDVKPEELEVFRELSQNCDAGQYEFDKDSPLRADPVAIAATLPADDVYFKLASLLVRQFARIKRSPREQVRFHIARILEGNVLLAMEQRLRVAYYELSQRSLRSCVEHTGCAIATFSRAGSCIFISRPAFDLLDGVFTKTIDKDGPLAPHFRTLLREFRERAIPRDPTWLSPISAALQGRRLRLYPLVVPDQGLRPALLHVVIELEGKIAVDAAARISHLTEREEEVVQEIVEGRRNAEIASHLAISPETVKTHVACIFRKLEVRNRADLVRKVALLQSPFTLAQPQSKHSH